MGKISKFLKFTSQRSGFDSMRIGMIKDGAWIVLPEEYDQPPPSRLPLGGEGDVARGSNANFAYLISSVTAPYIDIPTQYLTASAQIAPSTTQPWVRIVGSNTNVDLTSNPQMLAGKQGQLQTLQCVGSNVTLDDGTGLDLSAQGSFNMNSGAIITLIYTTANNVWVEVNRDRL